MKIILTTGYREEFWRGWPWVHGQMGGSEWMVYQYARTLADMGHDVKVRLPRPQVAMMMHGVLWIGRYDDPREADLLLSFDDFETVDRAPRRVLVACRSDPPKHTDWSRMVFLSKKHALLMGHVGHPAVGGGVDLADYPEQPVDRRQRRRVIYTSSPDRGGLHAGIIGRTFDFHPTYRGEREVTRHELIALQRTAMALIHPYDAPRESEFFCMAVLEAMAAGTPCVVSDGGALPELWGTAAIVLPLPIRYSQWVATLEALFEDPEEWQNRSDAGRALAARYTWRAQAERLLEVCR